METPASESQRQVVAAREELGHELDELTAAARSAVDIPAKIRKNPVQTAALAGGAGFLLLGGPRRVFRGVMGRIRPEPKARYDGLLPDAIAKAIKQSGGEAAPEVKAALEEDFADYLAARGKVEPQRTPQQSILKTYDALVGPLASLGAREIAERLFSADKDRPAAGSGTAEGGGPKGSAGGGSGVSDAGGTTTGKGGKKGRRRQG